MSSFYPITSGTTSNYSGTYTITNYSYTSVPTFTINLPYPSIPNLTLTFDPPAKEKPKKSFCKLSKR